MINIAVYPSIKESFGVSVVEASSCSKPVIISDIGGMPEIIENNITGLVVKSKDPVKLAEAIEKLVFSESIRQEMGKRGRENVIKNYCWQKNVDQMISFYEQYMIKGS